MASDHAALVARLEDAAVAHEYTASHLPREQAVEFAELTPAPAAVREPEGRPATVAEIKALEGNGIVQAAPPLPEPSEAQCEGGVTVRWCPKCGRCTCPAQNEKPDGWEENPTCPIHGDASTHGEPSEALEALAADVVNRFNPIAGHIVLRDLVLAALARVKGQ
jgi:hypothetical protein